MLENTNPHSALPDALYKPDKPIKPPTAPKQKAEAQAEGHPPKESKDSDMHRRDPQGLALQAAAPNGWPGHDTHFFFLTFLTHTRRG
jgi:hypothetical protein